MPEGNSTVDVVEIGVAADLAAPDVGAMAIETLEGGGILFLRHLGFELTPREREILCDAEVILPGRKERESRIGRPTLIMDPAVGKIERTKIREPERGEIEAMMTRFSTWAEDLILKLLPRYGAVVDRDRVTFRPCQRTQLQGLHVDSSYGHPTRGRGMLRVFCNVNPTGRPRVWHVGEPFEPFVARFVPAVRPHTAWAIRLGERLGIINGGRSPYDILMADIRSLAKRNEEYQKIAPRRVVEFPTGSSWLAITDLVTHGAYSGQHSLDQTFFLPIDGMHDPSRSSLRILERIMGRQLA